MIKQIVRIIVSIIGIGVAIYLSYLHGTVYGDNQGLIACACFMGFCSAYFLVLNISKMLKRNISKDFEE